MIQLQPKQVTRWQQGCGWIFALIFLLAFTVPFASILYVNFSHPFSTGTFPLFGIGLSFSSLFLLIPIAILWFMARGMLRLRARRRIGQPIVTISQAQLRVGDAFTVGYDHVFRRGVTLKSLGVQLVFREEATYSAGSSSSTVHKEWVVASNPYPEKYYDGGERFAEQFAWRIPPHAMHSFSGHHNKLLWMVRLQMEPKGAPKIVTEYPILVVPEKGM